MTDDLSRRLTRLAGTLRRNAPAIPRPRPTAPHSIRDDTILFQGKLLSRRRIVLNAPSCSTPTCTMCALPSTPAVSGDSSPTADDLIAQFNAAFPPSIAERCEFLTVFTNGNFFCDAEIAPEVRSVIYDSVAKSGASFLSVESLPRFATPARLAEAAERLGGKRLVLAMGLQSANDEVRELAIHSRCRKAEFEATVRHLNGIGGIALAFLLLKAPFLTEEESIRDALDSLRYLASLGVRDSILCPLQIAAGTVAQLLHERSGFRPPWLWSLIEIMERGAAESPGQTPILATSLLKGGGEAITCAANCPRCSAALAAGLEQANTTREFAALGARPCACRAERDRFMREETSAAGGRTLRGRIEQFLDEIGA